MWGLKQQPGTSTEMIKTVHLMIQMVPVFDGKGQL